MALEALRTASGETDGDMERHTMRQYLIVLSPFVGQPMRVLVVRHNRDDLAVLKELVEAGKLMPVIDRRYAVSDVPEALRYQGEGHTRGKVVTTL